MRSHIALYAILAFMVLYISPTHVDATEASCYPMRNETEANLLYSRSQMIAWVITNFTSYTTPLTNECVPIATVIQNAHPYEGIACFKVGSVAAAYIGECDGVANDGLLCYNRISASAECGCIGTSLDYQCVATMLQNKVANKRWRTPL